MDTAAQSGSSAKMAAHTKRKTPPNAIKMTAKKIAKVRKGATTTRAPIGNKRALTPESQSQSVTNAPTLPPLSPRARCAAGGPKGPKVYDDLGFLLSYSKCTRPGLFRRRRPTGKKYIERLSREAAESKRKGEIMGTPSEKQSALTSMAWDDRVARELGIMYHEVEMKHFEELAGRGFVGKDGEFEAVNINEEERNRLLMLAMGSAFRA